MVPISTPKPSRSTSTALPTRKTSWKRYSLYSNIAKTEVVDDLTAKVTLKTPFSPFINQLAHPPRS